MDSNKTKRTQNNDDRNLIPVSDLDEEIQIPMTVRVGKTIKIMKAPEANLGYR